MIRTYNILQQSGGIRSAPELTDSVNSEYGNVQRKPHRGDERPRYGDERFQDDKERPNAGAKRQRRVPFDSYTSIQ